MSEKEFDSENEEMLDDNENQTDLALDTGIKYE